MVLDVDHPTKDMQLHCKYGPWLPLAAAGLVAAALLCAMGRLHAADNVEFHVSPRGNDGQNGTTKRPVASLGRALELARQTPTNLARRVIMHGADYFGVAVTLGSAGAGLAIEAAPNK